MSELPSELKYASSHEWSRLEADGSVVVGITDHAQDQLGDVIYAETPEVGQVLAAGEEAGVVESVKAASDIYSPVAGEVIAVKVLIALKVAAFLAGLVLPVASFVAFGVRLLVIGVLSASMHR